MVGEFLCKHQISRANEALRILTREERIPPIPTSTCSAVLPHNSRLLGRLAARVRRSRTLHEDAPANMPSNTAEAGSR
jgi:hypothetical protein